MSELERRDAVVVESPRSGASVVTERAVALAGAVRRGTLKLALAAGLAAALIAYALLRHGWPAGAGRQVLTVIALAAAVAPPLVLLAFWQVVGELASLPERIRRLPLTGREHAEELGRIVRDTPGRPRRSWLYVPQLVWRLTRLTASSRDAFTPYAAVAPLLSVPFLALVAAAAAFAVVELVVAVAVAIVLLVT